MNILVTGGAGFIGSQAAFNFKKLGHNVTVLDNNPNLGRWLTAKKMGINRIKAHVADINNGTFDMLNFDAIIHCAAQTTATKAYENPRHDFINNVIGTFEVCEFARKKDAEIIFTSSNKVYGENVNKVALHELDTRWDFRGGKFSIEETFPIDATYHSPYGCSKLAADQYVQDYRYSYGLKTNVYRMSCIYGVTQTGTEDQGWVWHIIRQILNGEEVKIFGDGKQVRDILYVTDLIDLMKLTIDKNISGVWNVGGGRPFTISVLELIEKVDPTYENISYHDWRPADQKVYITNPRKVRKAFGWTPVITPDEGIEKIMETLKC